MLKQDLTSFQIFHGLSDDDADHVCQSLSTLQFSPGRIILNEGESVQALWIIVEGECLVSRSCDGSEDRTLAMLHDGDVFGEMSFVRDAPHSASIQAISDVTVCSYLRKDFLALLDTRPKAAWQVSSNIAAVLAERLRRMDTWVCDIMDRSGQQEDRSEWENFRSAVYTNWNF